MSGVIAVRLIWVGGAIHAGIVLANIPLPRRLRVRENLAGVSPFLRQIFYVHWLYIVLVVGMFSALCFGFARELAGASSLGRFLSAFMAGFWLLRISFAVFLLRPRNQARQPCARFLVPREPGRPGRHFRMGRDPSGDVRRYACRLHPKHPLPQP